MVLSVLWYFCVYICALSLVFYSLGESELNLIYACINRESLDINPWSVKTQVDVRSPRTATRRPIA